MRNISLQGSCQCWQQAHRFYCRAVVCICSVLYAARVCVRVLWQRRRLKMDVSGSWSAGVISGRKWEKASSLLRIKLAVFPAPAKLWYQPSEHRLHRSITNTSYFIIKGIVHHSVLIYSLLCLFKLVWLSSVEHKKRNSEFYWSLLSMQLQWIRNVLRIFELQKNTKAPSVQFMQVLQLVAQWNASSNMLGVINGTICYTLFVLWQNRFGIRFINVFERSSLCSPKLH